MLSRRLLRVGRLAIPQGLAASSITDTGFTLSWTALSGSGITYNVYQNGVKIATGLTGTSYPVTGLTAQTSYSFTVTAVQNGVEGQQSGSIPVNTLTPQGYRYWRLQSQGPVSSASVLSIGEWQAEYDGAQQSLVGKSISIVPGGVGWQGSYPLSRVNNGAINDWGSTLSWTSGLLDIMVDLGAAKSVKAMFLSPQSNGNYNRIGNLKIFYSADGVNWTQCANFPSGISWTIGQYTRFNTGL